jgi:hypothetical protein
MKIHLFITTLSITFRVSQSFSVGADSYLHLFRMILLTFLELKIQNHKTICTTSKSALKEVKITATEDRSVLKMFSAVLPINIDFCDSFSRCNLLPPL